MPTREQRGSTALFNLPEKTCTRWTAARKATIAAAIMHRRISLDAALQMYGLSVEELGSWLVSYQRFGPTGLYATKRLPRSEPYGASPEPAP